MSRSDPNCFPELHRSDENVCLRCFVDTDLKRLIAQQRTRGECDYCEDGRPRPLMNMSDMADYIKGRMLTFYGSAVDQLPYESREGGYQGWTIDTEDLLFETIGLDLENDHTGQLRSDLLGDIGDDTWCHFDWLCMDYDKSLLSSWSQFCDFVKTQRRYFFQNLGGEDSGHPDDRSVGHFLSELDGNIADLGMTRSLKAGQFFHRAQPRNKGEQHITAERLGPPPSEYALQSNRMNPPGIPMFYGSDSQDLAIIESQNTRVSIGIFTNTKPITIIDLANMPKIPGFYSNTPRRTILGLEFLYKFAEQIAKPVARDDRVHIEYIPTQILSEYFREFGVGNQKIDGVSYRSATGHQGINTVLFATQSNLITSTHPDASSARWLTLNTIEHVG